MASEEKIFEYFFSNFLKQIQNNNDMLGKRLLKEHFCKMFVKISAVT